MKAHWTAIQINYLNIFLMLLSAGLAFACPFELFLWAYAVLGPLHYLTEISWLHDKNYYTRGRRDYLFLASASVGITGLSLGLLRGWPRMTSEFLVYGAFAAGLIFLLVEKFWARVIFFALALLMGLFLVNSHFFAPLFGLFFPTLIHVFVFTGFFLLGGALKAGSKTGLMSAIVFGLIALAFFVFHPAHSQYHAGEYVRNNYGFLRPDGTGNSVFISVNYYILKSFGLHNFGTPTQPLSGYVDGINDFLYGDPVALSLMSFIAFSYTYHYLNWFSKTSIIGWHQVSAKRMAVIGLVWAASLFLYAWDYSLGFKWLFFLSFAHVLLEFPLNHLTMINIGKDFKRMITGGEKPGVQRGVPTKGI